MGSNMIFRMALVILKQTVDVLFLINIFGRNVCGREVRWGV